MHNFYGNSAYQYRTIAFSNELYHYGKKGMRWKKKGRKRNDSGKTGEVERRGEGLGSSPVGGQERANMFERLRGKKRIGFPTWRPILKKRKG